MVCWHIKKCGLRQTLLHSTFMSNTGNASHLHSLGILRIKHSLLLSLTLTILTPQHKHLLLFHVRLPTPTVSLSSQFGEGPNISHPHILPLSFFSRFYPAFSEEYIDGVADISAAPNVSPMICDLTPISLATRSHLFICHYIHHELKAKSSCVLKETSFDRGVPNCRGRRLSGLGVGRMCSFFFLLLGLGVFCWQLSSLCSECCLVSSHSSS